MKSTAATEEATQVPTEASAEDVLMQGAEIVTDTYIYMVSYTGALADVWPKIEATIALS